MKRQIEFLDLKKINMPYFDHFQKAFSDFLESGTYVLGEAVREFEKRYSEACSVKFSVGVNSGYDALLLPLLAYKELGLLNAGDEVLVPANTFIATPYAVSGAGLKPVFVSPDLGTMNITLEGIERSITPKTRVIMPVHLYGRSCEMDEICNFAKRNNLIVIEDSAQAHGAIYKGRPVGSWGDAAGFSFYPGKNIGALGDAGVVTTSSDELFHALRKIRNYGSDIKYVHELLGVNSRMDEVQACFLNYKLEANAKEIDVRRKIAKRYYREVYNEKVRFLSEDHSQSNVYHLFVVRVNDRRSFQSYLETNGIKSMIHYPVLTYKQKPYEGNGFEDKLLERAIEEIVSLPIGSHLSDRDVDYIIDVLNKF